MRRSLLSAPFIAALLLVSCAHPSDLPSDEVLKRAIEASGKMVSANFTLTGDIRMTSSETPASLHADMAGTLQDGGRMTSFTLALSGLMTSGGQESKATVDVEVISERESDVYVLLRSLMIDPPIGAFSSESLQAYIGQWWKFPSNSAKPATVSTVAPDPEILKAQTQIVSVLSDRGIETMNGRDAYAYDVTIDPERFVAFLRTLSEKKGKPFDEASIRKEIAGYDAKGELWIDHETYYVHKIIWSLQPKETMRVPYELSFQVLLTDHDAASAILIPQDAKVFGTSLPAVPTGSGSVKPVPNPLPLLQNVLEPHAP